MSACIYLSGYILPYHGLRCGSSPFAVMILTLTTIETSFAELMATVHSAVVPLQCFPLFKSKRDDFLSDTVIFYTLCVLCSLQSKVQICLGFVDAANADHTIIEIRQFCKNPLLARVGLVKDKKTHFFSFMKG